MGIWGRAPQSEVQLEQRPEEGIYLFEELVGGCGVLGGSRRRSKTGEQDG